MSNFDGAIAILSENREDIETLIDKFGGIGNVILAAPSLIRIMRTLSQHKDPVEAAAQAERVLAYNKQTMEKVRAFQKQNHIGADGIVGDETWTKVEELLALSSKGIQT